MFFYLINSGKDTRWASRSGYLSPAELLRFNNAPKVVAKYGTSIETALLSHIQETLHPDKNITHICVFGELYGGGKYEGFEAGVKAIQREVIYCPDIEFIVFDIECINNDAVVEETVNDEENDNSQSRESFFLSPVDVITACQACSVPVLDILHSGSLDEMLALNTIFQTTIPSVIGLPPLSTSNESEGYVLRPKHKVFYKPNGTRIMLKHKNPKFTENRSAKAAKVPKTTVPQPMELNEKETELYEQMKQFINQNRINAVLSKLDEKVKSNRKRTTFLIAKDAQEDIEVEMKGQLLVDLTAKAKNKLYKRLTMFTEEYCDFHNIDFMS